MMDCEFVLVQMNGREVFSERALSLSSHICNLDWSKRSIKARDTNEKTDLFIIDDKRVWGVDEKKKGKKG